MPRLSSVLLVDDDASANFLNKLLLQRAGVTEHLLMAEDAAQALRTLSTTCQSPDKAQCPDLILHARAQRHRVSPSLSALTRHPTAGTCGGAHSVERDLRQLQGLPFDGTLEKPPTAAKLPQMLNEHFPT